MTIKSFTARLAALEALEQESIGRYLPPERYALARLLLAEALIFDFGQGAPARYALHAPSYPDNPQFRASLAQRCEVLGLDLSFADAQAICTWLNQQPPGDCAIGLAPTEAEADVLDDDEVIALACYGLGEGRTLNAWNTGLFRVTFGNDAWGPRYWQRIAERAQALCDERGIVLFPLTPADTVAAIDLITSGAFRVRPRGPQEQDSHRSCIRFPAEVPNWSELFEQKTRLADALDTWLWQQRRRTGTPLELLSTADAVLALLEGIGAPYNHSEEATP
jgi:hypothetical protein